MNVSVFLVQLSHLLLTVYLLIVNLAGLIQMRIDKRRAIRQQQRISEMRLFLIAVIGGSVGSLIGMYLFRHKTKHLRFVLGIPLILLLQLALIGLIVYLIKFV